MYENERQRKFQFELEKVRSFFEAVLAMVIFLLAVLFVVVSLYNDDPNVKVVAFVLLLMILGLIVYATVSRLNRLDEIERKYIKSYWGELVMAQRAHVSQYLIAFFFFIFFISSVCSLRFSMKSIKTVLQRLPYSPLNHSFRLAYSTG